MQIGSKFALTVISLLGAVACGDDDGGSGGTGGVPSDKKIADLSESEARSLCRSLNSRFSKVSETQLNLTCTLSGALSSGGNASTCESAVDDCIEETEEEDLSLDCDGEDGENGGVSTTCREVTVGDLTACLDASEKALNDLAKKVTCDTDLEDLGDLSMSIDTPAACQKIEDDCPEVASMDDLEP